MLFLQYTGTAESARACVRDYFARLRETLASQEEVALSMLDTHVRSRITSLRRLHDDVTALRSHVRMALTHCSEVLLRVSHHLSLQILLNSIKGIGCVVFFSPSSRSLSFLSCFFSRFLDQFLTVTRRCNAISRSLKPLISHSLTLTPLLLHVLQSL